jgi:hypothetical protein
LNDGRIQNPSNPLEIVPLSNFVLRGFGFVHHSIAILYHEVPYPNLAIRNFFIAVWRPGSLGRDRVGLLRPWGWVRMVEAGVAELAVRGAGDAEDANHAPGPALCHVQAVRLEPEQVVNACLVIVHLLLLPATALTPRRARCHPLLG